MLRSFILPFIRVIIWAWQVARMGEVRHLWRALVGKANGKKSIDPPKRICRDNIKIRLKQEGNGGLGLESSDSS